MSAVVGAAPADTSSGMRSPTKAILSSRNVQNTQKIRAQGRKRVLIAAVILQRRIRSMLEGRAVRRRYQALHSASLVLQRWGRTKSQRSFFRRQKKVRPPLRVTLLLQRARTNKPTKNAMMAGEQGSELLQRAWRGMKGRHLVHELRTAVHLRVEKSFMEMHLERERLWLAVLQQLTYEADLPEVCAPLSVDFAINMDEVYQNGWASVLANMFQGSSTAGPRKVESICCGATSSTVLLAGGEVWTFGWGDCGQLGQGNCSNCAKAKRITRFQLNANAMQRSPVSNVYIKKIACGDEHSAILSDSGDLFTFGSNSWGQLGQQSNTGVKRNFSTTPKSLKLSRPVTDVACGGYHTAVILEGGTILSWGSWNMQRPEPDDLWMPKRIMKSPHASRAVQCGRTSTAVISHDGEVWMWGSNQNCQLGLGSTLKEAPRPTRILWAPRAGRARAPGEASSPATLGARVLFTDDESRTGRIKRINDGKYMIECDDGVKMDQVPRKRFYAMEPLKLKQLAVGSSHCVGIATSGALVAWGSNKYGQIGSGDMHTKSFPTRVTLEASEGPRPQVIQVAAGLRHTVAITASCQVFAWGTAGSFRFVSPAGTDAIETYSRSREPMLKHPDLLQYPGSLSSNKPVQVAGWSSTESHSTPLGLSVSCAFSRSMSITLLSAKFTPLVDL